MTQPVLFAVEDGEHSAVAEGGIVDFESNDYKGKVSEAAFAYQAVLRGWDVIDAGAAPDYDRIVKRPYTRAILVQVKRAYRDEGRTLYIVNCSKSRKGASGRQQYSATAFDILAVHLADIDQWVFYTRAEIGNRVRATYILPHERKNKTSVIAMAARDPDNWELFDQVAAMYSQESLGVAQPMSHPIPQNLPIP
jgi:hypothetical protein